MPGGLFCTRTTHVEWPFVSLLTALSPRHSFVASTVAVKCFASEHSQTTRDVVPEGSRCTLPGGVTIRHWNSDAGAHLEIRCRNGEQTTVVRRDFTSGGQLASTTISL